MPIKFLRALEGGREGSLFGWEPRPASSALDGAEQHTCAELAESQSVRADPSARCARGEETRTGSSPGCWRPTSPHTVSKDNIKAPGLETTRGNRDTETPPGHEAKKGDVSSPSPFAHDHPLKTPLDQSRQQAMHLDAKTTITPIGFCLFL